MRFTAPDGREIRESTQTADKRQAQEYHDARKAELWRQAKLGEQPRHTWQEAVVRWIEEHPDRKGLVNVKIILRQADPVFGGCALDEITSDALARHIAQRRASGVKNSTLRLESATVRTILNAAHRWQWLATVPPSPRIAGSERRIRWLTRDEVDRVLAELPDYLASMARFSLATGLRERNVCQLGAN